MEKYFQHGQLKKCFSVDFFLVEFGFNARAYYKFDIMNNISMENILNLVAEV